MAALRLKKKNRYTAPATIYFVKAKNKEDKQQPCVFAQCQYSGARAGPIWGHTEATVRRGLATLTQLCPCRRMFHSARHFTGHRIVPPRDSAQSTTK